MPVSAIIPAYNEERTLAATIRALTSIPEISEIIVVDDGSADATAQVARDAGADCVVVLPRNIGKGGALLRGVDMARGDVLCFVDGDLGSSAVEFSDLLKPVLHRETDMAVASWPRARRKGGFGLVKGLASWGIYLLTGFHPGAPLSGQRVLRRAVFEKAVHSRDGFGVEVGLTVGCLRNGYNLQEVPVAMKHRETGRTLSGFVHRGRQFIQVFRTLWRMWQQPKERR